MKDAISATELRSNVYTVLDEILKTGKPREVVRRGERLVIMPVTRKRLRLDRLPRRDVLACTFDELVDTSWADA